MFGRRGARRSRRRHEPDPQFWKQRGWQASAAFLAAVLVMGAVSALVGDDPGPGTELRDRGSDAADAGPTPSSGPGTSGQRADGRPSGCRTDDSKNARPKAAPQDVKWRRLDAAMVPVSRSAGPLLSDGPVWRCFARTPMGAVMATHVIPAHMGGDDWRTVTRQQLLPGPGRDAFVTQRSRVSDADIEERSVAAYAGFSVTSYSPDSARVRLLIRSAQGNYTSTSVSVRWSEGDWKVAPSTDGSLHSSITAVAGASGFILWGA